MADAVVKIGADLSELRRALADIPNQSSEAAQKTLIALEKTVKRAEAASKKAIKSTKKAQQEASKAAAEQAKAAEDGFKGLIELSGTGTDKFDKFKNVLGAMGSPIGAITLGVTGAGLAVAGLVTGVTSLVLAADDLQDSLKPFEKLEGFEGLDPAAVRSIEQANAAADSLGVIAKAAAVTMAGEFAPAVEKATRFLVTMGLVALDAWNTFADGNDVVRELAIWFGDKLVKAITGPIDGIFSFIEVMGDLASLVPGLEDFGESVAAIGQKWDDFTHGVAAAGVDALFEATGDAVGDLENRFASYGPRVDALIAKSKKLADAQKGVASSSKDAERALKEQEAALEKLVAISDRAYRSQLEGSDKIEQARIDELNAIEEIVMKYPELEEAAAAARVEVNRAADMEIMALHDAVKENYLAGVKKQEEAAITSADAVKAANLAATNQVIGAVGDLSQFIIDQGEMRGEAGQEAALKAFKVQQAAGIASATISGLSAGIAAFQPPPVGAGPVLGAILAAAIGVSTAATIGQIASQAPPAFDIGGMVGAGGLIGSQTPDQVLIRALPGERVQSREEAAGAGRPQELVIVNQYKHRVFNAFVKDNLKLAGSPLNSAFSGTARVGHR